MIDCSYGTTYNPNNSPMLIGEATTPKTLGYSTGE